MATSKMPSALLIVSYTCAFLPLTQTLTILTVGVRMTTAFVDFNGVVPEKFDAVRLSHLVDAEYGNQGIDFKMVPREGFGWMNGTSPDSSAFFSPSPTSPGHSCIPSRPVVPDEPHAPRRRGVHLPGGLLRTHDDGRAYRRAALDLR